MGARDEGYKSPYGRRPNLRARWGPGEAERFERDKRCVEMKAAGHSWVEIVDQLGYASTGHARDRWSLFLQRMPPREDAEQQRELEMQRLDRLAVALEPKIQSHDVRAIEVAIKLLERRARLTGADMPVRQQVTIVTDETIAEIISQRRAAVEAKRNAALAAGIDLGNIIDAEIIPEIQPAPKD